MANILLEYLRRIDERNYLTEREHKQFLSELEKPLDEILKIRKSNPNEALNCLERIDKEYATIGYEDFNNCYNTIKQYILKAQEQEKENAEYKRVLEIIKEKDVKIHLVKRYNNFSDYNNCMFFSNTYLTQEEFVLLKEMLE